MKTVLIILAVFGIASAFMAVSACMLSSQISQMEEHLGVYKDYNEDN